MHVYVCLGIMFMHVIVVYLGLSLYKWDRYRVLIEGEKKYGFRVFSNRTKKTVFSSIGF